MLSFYVTRYFTELYAHMIVTLSTTLIYLSKVQSDGRDENNIFEKGLFVVPPMERYDLEMTFWLGPYGFGIYLDFLQEVVLQGLHHLFSQLLLYFLCYPLAMVKFVFF